MVHTNLKTFVLNKRLLSLVAYVSLSPEFMMHVEQGNGKITLSLEDKNIRSCYHIHGALIFILKASSCAQSPAIKTFLVSL